MLKITGSITKSESLAKISSNIHLNTIVAEANHPYSNYYGRVPETPNPNSLFLFTERFYTLEEALRLTQNINVCSENRVNAATSTFFIKNQRIPAIRIRNFPDYKHLKTLQQCYIDQGVTFEKKVPFVNEAVVTVNKCFSLEKKDDGIFLDNNEKNEGYISIPIYPEWDDFIQLIQTVRNNSDCKLFDAALGGLIIDGKVTNIIRIYSGHIDTTLLKYLKNQIQRWI